MSTVDLLVLTCSDQPLLTLQTLSTFFTLMRRSTVLRHPPSVSVPCTSHQGFSSWPKWPVDQMTSRPNDQLTKWPVDQMTSWPNDQLTKWPVDQMTSWPNDQLTKWGSIKMPLKFLLKAWFLKCHNGHLQKFLRWSYDENYDKGYLDYSLR